LYQSRFILVSLAVVFECNRFVASYNLTLLGSMICKLAMRPHWLVVGHFSDRLEQLFGLVELWLG